jgi:ethanolamine utilization protein EutN
LRIGSGEHESESEHESEYDTSTNPNTISCPSAMQLAFVVGTLVATQKHRKFDGSKLLLVQPVAVDDTPRGPLLLATDTVGAGVGEKVLVVLDGKAAADAMERRGTPVDAAILGIVDRVDCNDDLVRA